MGLNADTLENATYANSYQEATNAGVITVPTDYITVAEINDVILHAGDILLISGHVFLTKGLTAGTCELQVTFTGDTGIFNNKDLYKFNKNTPISEETFLGITPFIKITKKGTLNILIQCRSLGSDSTISAGESFLQILFIKKG